MRHDVDEARYRDFGEKFRQQLVELALPAQADGAPMLYSGMGTLIAPNWVLTAGHAVAYMQTAKPTAPDGHYYVFVKGRGYVVAKMIVHPQYDENGYVNDIALIKLEHDVREASPACLYDKDGEKDQIVSLAGTGFAGDGVRGPGLPDGALRGATVRVDTADGTQLAWMFRKPDDPRTTPLEGISGPGDSGGPAFITVNGKPCIAGVSSNQRIELSGPPPKDGSAPGGNGEDVQGRYGVTEVYTRVSKYVSWIRQTMSAN